MSLEKLTMKHNSVVGKNNLELKVLRSAKAIYSVAVNRTPTLIRRRHSTTELLPIDVIKVVNNKLQYVMHYVYCWYEIMWNCITQVK